LIYFGVVDMILVAVCTKEGLFPGLIPIMPFYSQFVKCLAPGLEFCV